MSENCETLNDVCEFIVDCLHATAPTQDEGYPLIRTPNVGKGRLILDDVYRVSEETYKKWTSRAVPEANDLILAREAPAGNVAIIKNGKQVCLGQRTVHLRPDVTKVDPDFLCYFMLTPQNQGALLATETGATAKHVNMKDIRRLKLNNLPKLEIQQKIGSCLSAYDDLIKNNRRRIQLLEESARLLYKEWFVHLRFPGHEHVKNIDGVPEGWERKLFHSLLAFEIGGGWGQDEHAGNSSEPAYVIRGTDFPAIERGNLKQVQLRYHKESAIMKRRLTHGDILFEVSGGSANQPIGRSLLITQNLLDAFSEDVICASFCKRFVPSNNLVSVFLGYFLDHIRSTGELLIYKKDSASALQNFNYKAFMTGQRVLLPSSHLMQEFADLAWRIKSEISCLEVAIDRLEKARDFLLPRLMNGEVAI